MTFGIMPFDAKSEWLQKGSLPFNRKTFSQQTSGRNTVKDMSKN
jgi:hypothetical protein